jgi:glutamine amidotransferase
VNKVVVLDYKAGNLTSVVKALTHLGAECTVTANPAELSKADRVVLPGVGHFSATQLLDDTGLTLAIHESNSRGIPFLGICVGLQWLFEGSSEAPEHKGLGTFQGVCERFPEGIRVPHVGWNSIEVKPDSRLMKGIPNGSYVYYTHSYRAPMVNATVAVTEYGGAFTGAAEQANVMGVQFHPEKSSETGLILLRNFLSMEAGC